MRRLALIFGMLLTLTTGGWGDALAASVSCMHEAGAAAATDEHDCCRANIDGSNAHHSAPGETSQATSQHASHAETTTRGQSDESHAGMNCGGVEASSEREIVVVSIGERESSCAECCAGGSGQTPATAVCVAPEQNKVKRDAGSASAGAHDLFADAPAHVSPHAPTQHAPPAPPVHRHILISVFLI